MKMCTYIFFLYSISHIGAFLALTEESPIDAGLRPLILGPDKNIPPKEPPENEILTTHMLKCIQEEANTLANLSNTEERAALIFGKLKTHAITIAECHQTTERYAELVKNWSMVRARSAIEYFEDTYGLDSDISTEEVTKMKDLIKRSDAVRKTRGEKIYEEKVYDQLKIYRRAALWYKILCDNNTIYPATILLGLIKANKDPPKTKPEFSLCIAQAYKDLSQALIHPAILKSMTGSNMYDVNLAVFGCSSAALKILLSIYTLDPPSRSTDTS
ncbi:unnamed protein product [Bemisia tabaci]|uniref:Uncharacterized protein n=1 Tax=Bemisia tabaci TaxID=7038 RepID=A0A9P0EWU0_BEMTA|nr:unnamed protein product [Bemisia tabaci]